MTKTLGIIGGLGPLATAYFYELLIEMIDAKKDQEHLEVLIYSKPSTPDRTEYILERSKDNPLESMVEMGNKLSNMGADFIAIPCITAHYFHEQLVNEIPIPIIHLVRETVRYLKERDIRSVGIMATEGTVISEIFQKELSANGMDSIVPDAPYQRDIGSIIYEDIKSGGKPRMDLFHDAKKHLKDRGAEIIILGCTELSLIKRDYDIGNGFIDAMEVLALCSIEIAGGRVKDRYSSGLIT